MNNMTAEVDFIEELRLRCWAREHYVPTERRENNMHPVVIDEMRRKDREMSTAFSMTA